MLSNFSLVFLAVFNAVALNQSHSEGQVPCTESHFHMKSVLYEFVKDQRTMVIIEGSSQSQTSKRDIFMYFCVFGELDLPYMHFSSVINLGTHIPKPTSNYYGSPGYSYCFIIITDDFASVSEDLSILGQMSPTSKFVFILKNGTTLDGGNLLKVIWTSHSMKRVIALVFLSDHLALMNYHPFEYADGTTAYGRVSKIEINSSNSMQVGRRITRSIDRQDNWLNQYPLRVYIFESPTTAKAVYNRSNTQQLLGFTLIDGELLTIFQKKINFTPKFVGNISTNSFVGSIGAIDNNEADFGANSRIIAKYYTDNTEFLFSCYSVDLLYIVPRIFTPRILNAFVYSLFDLYSQILMVFTFLTLIVTLFVLNHFYEKMTHRPEGNSIARALLIVASTQFFISIRFTRVLKCHQQIIIAAMLLYGVIVSSNYQSSVVNQLASRDVDHNINTLDKLIESNLTIYYSAMHENFITPAVNSSETSLSNRLFGRQKKYYGTLAAAVTDMITNKSVGVLVTATVADEIKAKYYDNETFEDLVHIVNERPGHFFNSYIVPRASPYRTSFNRLLLQCIEHGIVNYELSKNEFRGKYLTYISRGRHGLKKKASLPIKPISVGQLSILFSVWAFLLALSGITLLIEIFVEKRLAQRNDRLKKMVLQQKDEDILIVHSI